MRLYEGSGEQFMQDVMLNKFASKLEEAYKLYYGHSAPPGEIGAWTNSFEKVKNLIVLNTLNDIMMIVEFELPYSQKSRIDCMFFGKDTAGNGNVILLELKQWSQVKDSEIDGNVITYVGKGERDVPHPSLQVKGYHDYLLDYMPIFEEAPSLNLSSCAYCHNYTKHENIGLYDKKFDEILRNYPVYSKDDVKDVGNYLKEKLAKGEGLEIFDRFITARIKPTKRLIDYSSKMVEMQKVFTLIDEQIAANNAIIDRAKKCTKLKKKSVIIIRGGPGTGKSVIALNAFAKLLSEGKTIYHATGSSAFTTTLRKLMPRVSGHFKYFNSDEFKHKISPVDSVDVLICDEAHRIREYGNTFRTPKAVRSELSQIEELIRVAKVSIFFVDDSQIVLPREVGHSDVIRKMATKYEADIFDYELTTQFRCAGSNSYMDWLDEIFGLIEPKGRILRKNESLEFKIFETPNDLWEAVKEKNAEKPNSARLVAGYCWKWNDPNPDGTLPNDVVIGDFAMSWEGKKGNGTKEFKLAKGIPPAPLWAYDPNGVNQIGTIYTIQGFEFDYVGVIIAKDLSYDPNLKQWTGHPENSSDKDIKLAQGQEFTKYVKNVYRTLLTRGMKGCYVYFMDKDTENFFRSKIEKGK